jgi:hypothetical protein
MENTGLHQKYFIQKIKRIPVRSQFGYSVLRYETKLEPVDPMAEYFVLRLDDIQKDKVHMDACRKSVLFYADLIKDHLPELSNDLIQKYGI